MNRFSSLLPGNRQEKGRVIMQSLYNQIAALGRQYGADKVVLFGSRARGDHRERSDIDLAVYGMEGSNQSCFRMDLEDLPTLLKFDVVFVSPDTSPKLMNNIERDGVELYGKEK